MRLEQAILNTIRYFDGLDMPVTVTQVWRCLVIDSSLPHPSLRSVRETLLRSPELGNLAGNRYGYYFLRGREQLVEERLTRHAIAQMKWKIFNWFSGWLAAVPFVRGLAASGSFALDHTKPSSDLDMFVIVAKGRIWTTRLLLLVVTQLLGRRRKYWHVQAPDKVCLNHYITEDVLLMPAQVQNLYTAVQYTLHVPVFGAEVLDEFRAANQSWISRFVSALALPAVRHRYTVSLSRLGKGVKEEIEKLLLEPIGDWIERIAERMQRAVIARHHSSVRGGRVVLAVHELAFHPDTKVPALLAKYAGKQTSDH